MIGVILALCMLVPAGITDLKYMRILRLCWVIPLAGALIYAPFANYPTWDFVFSVICGLVIGLASFYRDGIKVDDVTVIVTFALLVPTGTSLLGVPVLDVYLYAVLSMGGFLWREIYRRDWKYIKNVRVPFVYFFLVGFLSWLLVSFLSSI